MYYVVHKLPNLSKVAIHLGTHSHLVIEGMCRKSFEETKNMVADEVCHTPTTTSLAIALCMSKSFLFHHLCNEDGKGLVEFLKGEKLNQTLLKFTPLCSPSICNLIASLKHCPNSLSSLDFIFKLQVLFDYNYIQNNYFPGQ